MSIISAGTSNTSTLVYTGDTTGNLAFQINGNTEAMRITSGQNVGIGLTNPDSKLHISGVGVGAVRFLYNGLSENYFDADLNIFRNKSNAEAMRIDSAGRVTAPLQPAFSVYRTTTSPHNSVIVYNNTYTNVGSHYSISTGRFTAPVSGTYYFYATALSITNSGTSRMRMRVNGTYKSGEWRMPNTLTSGAGDRYMWGTISFVYYLNASDYIDVHYSNDDGSSTLYGDTTPYTTFGGYLIG